MLRIRTASQQAAELIRDAIVRGELALGQRLVVRDLAQSLGISATPVREALSRLAAEGLVISKPHTGIRVADPTAKDLDDLFETRLCLELGMVDGLLANAGPDEIARLRELAMESGLRDFKREGFHDLTFHRHVAALADNPHLARLREQVNSLLRVYYVKYISEAGDEARQQHVREEERICDALAAHDAEALRQAIVDHTRNMKALVLTAHQAVMDAQGTRNQPTSDRRPSVRALCG